MQRVTVTILLSYFAQPNAEIRRGFSTMAAIPKTNVQNFLLDNIEPIKHVGIWCWNPMGLPDKNTSAVTARDILQGLTDNCNQPSHVVPLRRIGLPMQFSQIPANVIQNVFPWNFGYIVPLFVAKERGLNLKTVDFFINGNDLHVLASKEIYRGYGDPNKRYLAQKFPYTGITAIGPAPGATLNTVDVGFQFVRLLTNQSLLETSDLRRYNTLNVVKIAGYTVLVDSYCDAVDDAGQPMPLISKNPAYGPKTKILLQMLTQGSKELIAAERKGLDLQSLFKMNVDDLVKLHSPQALATAKMNIAAVLAELKKSTEIRAEEASEMNFEDGHVVLKPCDGESMFPPVNVVGELGFLSNEKLLAPVEKQMKMLNMADNKFGGLGGTEESDSDSELEAGASDVFPNVMSAKYNTAAALMAASARVDPDLTNFGLEENAGTDWSSAPGWTSRRGTKASLNLAKTNLVARSLLATAGLAMVTFCAGSVRIFLHGSSGGRDEPFARSWEPLLAEREHCWGKQSAQ